MDNPNHKLVREAMDHVTVQPQVTPPPKPEMMEVLTWEAMVFIRQLARVFSSDVTALLERRKERQEHWDRGEKPEISDTPSSQYNWKIAPLPDDLLTRRVEITGPPEHKMIIHALNSGADCYMSDFEDSLSPTWEKVIMGQYYLMQAVRRTLTFEKGDRVLKIGDDPATLIVRPRGWHLKENNITVDGEPVPAALVDFGLYFFHNAKELINRGSGPYFYLPKLEGHTEAALWNRIFVYAQEQLGIPKGTIKATVLLETLPAAFEMDLILNRLENHAAGLNCGRWDYIFSYIKCHQNDPAMIVPDRDQIDMTQHFMRSYSQLVIKTCHRHGAMAIGGMAAQVPIKNDEAANNTAIHKVRVDKLREALAGHDGTWVAHPGLVSLAMEIFTTHLGEKKNQLDVKRDDFHVSAKDLLRLPEGTCTEQGLRKNVRVGIYYLEAWLRGNGCVPLYNLMEDAATAEISRTQVWQQLAHQVQLEDGRTVNKDFLDQIVSEEMKVIEGEVGESHDKASFEKARDLFVDLATQEKCPDFLTLSAYPML